MEKEGEKRNSPNNMNLLAIPFGHKICWHNYVFGSQIRQHLHPFHARVKGFVEHLKQNDAQRVNVHFLVVYHFVAGL